MKRFLLLLSLIELIILTVNAQDSEFYGSLKTLKNTTNETADSSYVVTDLGDMNHFGFEIVASGGVTIKAYAVYDESATDTDTSDWVNYNQDLFGADSIVNPRAIYYMSEYFNPTKVMFYIENSDDSNACKITQKKSR